MKKKVFSSDLARSQIKFSPNRKRNLKSDRKHQRDSNRTSSRSTQTESRWIRVNLQVYKSSEDGFQKQGRLDQKKSFLHLFFLIFEGKMDIISLGFRTKARRTNNNRWEEASGQRELAL
jgi:hypothetical protein